ncbi:ErfK/YbiS/YcfS/YnhG family protein/Tat domain protein [hydrothermal vent metagenome]|uniref:ErfK/YbiS/YcfS/YnhG family protein/Tat domain protein n=1 Tax=hydrothermal vent metagenome TaxID=652676 RepID=A0A3B0TEG4_9ZZZZ
MLNRRNFLTSGLATGLFGLSSLASPALAHKAKGRKYVLPKKYMPREVRLRPNSLPAGEIHVYPDQFYLYWTLPGDKAIRYGVGVGRGNLYHPGTFYVGAKKEWPEWTPTKDMIKREPELFAKWAGGMPGGIENPLGARALYLFTRAKGDSFLRLHGTNDPRTIGVAVSNGCARLVNDHVIDLYNRVPMGTKVVLYKKAGAGPAHT